jgi:hypothetical protein
MRKNAIILVAIAGLFVAVAAPVALATHVGNSHDHNVPVCHKGHTIYVNTHAVPAHLRHGDAAGPCATPTPRVPTATPVPPTATEAPPTATEVPPTATGTPATAPTATDTPAGQLPTETPIG